MATIGLVSLFLALGAAVFSVIVSLTRFFSKSRDRLAIPVWSVTIACGLLSLAVLVLLFALIHHDFSLEYVASYTSTNMSLPYLISALWAGNSGSLMFWAWFLSVCAVVFIFQKRNRQSQLLPVATPVIMLTIIFFLLLLVTTSNPFVKLANPPEQGQGLNPLLENPGMIFHPPLLLIGYLGFTIPFALAVAVLLNRKLDDSWLASARRWSLFSWLFLGVGNLVGAWWAYVELGWGGYWAWDPVENAGLMPWLVATAFVHSLIMQKRRGTFKLWNIVLIILTFNLTIFGTFLTRTGFISSVHTFQNTGMGPFFLVFLAITFFIPMGLLISRRKELKSKEEIETIVSRESTFFLNNILLLIITAVILLGSLFPAFFELTRGEKIGVNASFFNMVNTPLLIAVILLAGLCTVIGWKQMTGKELWRRLLWPLALTIILGVVLIVMNVRTWYVLAGYLLCAFTLTAVASQWFFEIGAGGRKPGEWLLAFWRLLRANRRRYGAYIVHISLAIMAIGIIGSSLFDVEKEETLTKGQSMVIKDYSLTYEKISVSGEGDKDIVTATVSVEKSDRLLRALTPAQYYHRTYDQPVSEVAIRSSLSEDLYVILTGWGHDGTATFHVLVNPLVAWIWIGGGLFMVGGLISFWPGLETPPAEPGADRKQPGKLINNGKQPVKTAISTANKKRPKYGKR